MFESSMEDQRAPEVRLSDETIKYLELRIAEAVAGGLKAAMTPEAAERFWETGFAMLARQARNGTGDFVLGGLRRAIRTAMWVGFGALILYSAGGWAAIKSFWILMASPK